MRKTCEICGTPSGMYPLCFKHAKLAKENKVIKNEKGKWIEIKDCEVKNDKCILCEKETSKDFWFCKNCFKEVREKRNSFNHNRQRKNIEEHYYLLRSEILPNVWNIEDDQNKNITEELIKEYAKLMYSLAEEYSILFKNEKLLKQVEIDFPLIKKKIEYKKKIKTNDIQNKTPFNDEDFRNKWPREHQCEDGHYVRSEGEMIIDNWLYNNDYQHAYEKRVYMDSDPNAIVLSDFYIKKGNVYIEYWGVENDEFYEKRKQIKIKLYEENKINRIDITQKELKRLSDILPRELAKYIK